MGMNILRRRVYSSIDMTTLTTCEDEARILIGAQQGDHAAFGKIVTAYQKKTYGIAYGFVGNREDALEMAQEAFVKAYKAIARFDTDLPFYPWLYRIVKNTCLNHLKKRKRRGETSLDGLMDLGYDPPSPNHTPERCAELADLQHSIVEGLGELSDSHREIITLRHLHELSYIEISECLDIPKGTVMSRLHSARHRLRDVMETPN